MKKDIVQYRMYGFRLTREESVPSVVVALDLEEAVKVWLLSHDFEEPYDVHYMGLAYGQIELPF